MTEDWKGDTLMTIWVHWSRAFCEFRYDNTDLENSQTLI